MTDLVIIGTGFFAEDLLDNIRELNEETPTWNVLGFVDDTLTGEFDGIQILGTLDDFLKMDRSIHYIVADLDGRQRERIMNICKAAGFTGAVIIGSKTIPEENIAVGEGSYISGRCSLLNGCRIGPGTIIENATVCQEAQVGAYSTCRVFTNIGKEARIGKYNTFDRRCTVDDGVVTADGCSFQIGTVVLHDAAVTGQYAGIPAKLVRAYEE